MNLKASEQFGTYYARLPLVQSATIVHGNALRLDWESVVPKNELSYILGNPPFVGYSNQSAGQKDDILSVYLDANGKPFKTAGKIDYVAAWYYKAAKYIHGAQVSAATGLQPISQRFSPSQMNDGLSPTFERGWTPQADGGLLPFEKRAIRAAFVSTNSITQGEQVANLWKPLFEMFGIQIDFAYRTFKWSNEAKGKAAVHCVIIGFSTKANTLLPFERGWTAEPDGGLLPFKKDTRYGEDLLPRNKTLKSHSRQLRTNATKQERHLWYDFLRHCEPRFTRQRIIGEYIVDFYCHEAALIIELDGGHHYDSEAMEYDKTRTAYLNALGLQVLRFANNEVEMNFAGVCAAIQERLNKTPDKPLSAAGGGLPLSKGDKKPPPRGHLPSRGNVRERIIYDSDGTKIPAKNINPYLVDAPDVLIASRSKPICDVPIMYLGNKPADGGHLILTSTEKDALLAQEPQAEKLIKRYIGAVEFINGKERFCLWLKDIPYSDVKKCPSVMERLKRVRAFRLASTAKPTVEKAETPHLFFFISQPENDYLLIPSTSSENRPYIPIGYMDKDTVSGNANMILPEATLYHFGVLTSNVHMAWVRAVCGRLKSDYRYTGAIVYNNFPWPDAANEQKALIEKLAQGVLDARALYPGSTLADMYGENSMPFHPELVKAHKELDRAVMRLYGFTKDMAESAIVAALMERYQNMIYG